MQKRFTDKKDCETKKRFTVFLLQTVLVNLHYFACESNLLFFSI